MTDSEAFAFHFAELDRRGLDGPVPEGWELHKDTQHVNAPSTPFSGWARLEDASADPYEQWFRPPCDPSPLDVQALGLVLTQALADAGNLTIHQTRDGLNTVTTPAFTVHRKALLAGLVEAYWKMRGDG